MYLGIDLGTSEVKALVIDENNGVVATHSAPLTIQRPKPHWSEQSPEAWWEATEYLIATLREKCGHHWQAIKPLAFPDRCTVRYCWMPRVNPCVRPSCGMTPLRAGVRRAGRDGARAAPGGGEPGNAGVYGTKAALGAPS